VSWKAAGLSYIIDHKKGTMVPKKFDEKYDLSKSRREQMAEHTAHQK
jgi:hypothetical protein